MKFEISTTKEAQLAKGNHPCIYTKTKQKYKECKVKFSMKSQ